MSNETKTVFTTRIAKGFDNKPVAERRYWVAGPNGCRIASVGDKNAARVLAKRLNAMLAGWADLMGQDAELSSAPHIVDTGTTA